MKQNKPEPILNPMPTPQLDKTLEEQRLKIVVTDIWNTIALKNPQSWTDELRIEWLTNLLKDAFTKKD